MSNENIIRAWKDEDYWNSLSEEQRSQLPENPAGIIELSDEQSQSVGGGSIACVTIHGSLCHKSVVTCGVDRRCMVAAPPER